MSLTSGYFGAFGRLSCLMISLSSTKMIARGKYLLSLMALLTRFSILGITCLIELEYLVVV